MSPNKALFTITILLSMVYQSSCIYCFYCNSANNSACIDPNQYDDEIRSKIIPVINCDAAVPKNSEYRFFCRKIFQTIFHHNKDSDLRVTRGCGWVEHPVKKDCYRADTQTHLETVCSCYSDFCNSAESINPSTATAMFVALTLCLYFYRDN